MSTDPTTFVQLSPRGQVTLPKALRQRLGIRPGDPLLVAVENGRITLSPAVVVPVEQYTDERIAEFEEVSRLSAEEVERARKLWKL